MRRPIVTAFAIVVVLAGGASIAYALIRARGPAPAVVRPPTLSQFGIIAGVDANTVGQVIAPAQRKVSALGVHWMREQFTWPEIEPVRGRYRFGRYDALIAGAARRGLHVLPMLLETPPWLSPNPLALPPSLPAWRAFVSALVRRYGPGGSFWRAHPQLDPRFALRVWELWNEPYFPVFSVGGPNPGYYARMVDAAVRAGRAANPQTSYLAAAETSYMATDGTTHNWLAGMLAAVPQLPHELAGLAVHPYTLTDPESFAVPRDEQFRRFVDVERTLHAAGDAPLPLWITEIGWSTCTSRPPCVSETTQARYLSRMYRLVEQRYATTIRAIFVYDLQDIPAGGPADQQSGFGLIRLLGRHKPSYAVVAAAAGGPGP